MNGDRKPAGPVRQFTSPVSGSVRRFIRLIAALLVLAPGVAASARSSTPQPPDNTQATSCSASRLDSLVKLVPAQVLQQMVLATPMLSERAVNTILVNRPHVQGSDDLRFRVLLTPSTIGRLSKADVDGVRELRVLNTQQVSSDAGKSLGVDNSLGWYELTFQGPSSSRLLRANVTRDRVLAVYACSSDDRLIASGTTGLKLTSYRLSLLLSVLLAAVIYLIAVTVVWRARNEAAKTPRNVQAPQRWHKVSKVSWLRCLDPVVLSGDAYDRGNLAKLQILGFTLLVVFGMALLALRTGVLSELSPSIIYLLGLPALGSLGAGLATVTRDRLSSENWAWLVSKGVLPVNDRTGSLPRWREIFTNDEELDLYKIQAAAFSLVVALGLIQTGIFSLGKFTVPETVLQILGLSQLVFVGGRLTKPTTIGDLDKLITELKLRAAALRRASATSRDVDLDGKVGAAASAVAGPYANLAAASAAGAIPNAVQRYQDSVDEVAVILESVSHSPVDRTVLAPQFP